MYGILKDFGLPTYLAGIIILVSIAYKRIKEHQAKNLNSSKEQLEAIVALLSDKEKMSNKLLVEQVFNYKFREYIPYSVIMILLEFENPTEGIKKWLLGKNHLITDHNQNRIGYLGRMASESYRKTWRNIDVIGYFVFAFAGFGLLLNLPNIFVAVHYAWVIGSGVLVLYLLWIAYAFMTSALSIKAAEAIVNEFGDDTSTPNTQRSYMNYASINKFIAILKIRLFTIRNDLAYIFAISAISVILYEFWLINVPTTNNFYTGFGQIYVRICYSFISSFIFYFVVVHLQNIKNRVKCSKFINNKTVRIKKEMDSFLRELYHHSGSKYSNNIPAEAEMKEMLVKIKTKTKFSENHEPLLEFNDWYEYFTYKGQKIKNLIYELLTLKDILETDYVGALTEVEDLVSTYFIFEHRKYSNNNIEFMSSCIIDLNESIQDLFEIFESKYKKYYLVEYHIEARIKNVSRLKKNPGVSALDTRQQ